MLTDPAEIRRLARQHEAEDLEFRRYVHGRHISDHPLRERAAALLQTFDCKSCGNCCRQTRVPVSADGIAAIAAFLGMDAGKVRQLYTERGDDSSETLLRQQDDACVFLDAGLCMVYAARPEACRQFPAIALHADLLGNRMPSVCRQAAICPVVFQALEEFKHLTGFHPKARHGVEVS
ncbi:MAG: hypothetical protein C0504_18365 [Candidatus Solibacter sp.]|nr:hypothetical protein [Candidatus Solibacter sp.]